MTASDLDAVSIRHPAYNGRPIRSEVNARVRSAAVCEVPGRHGLHWYFPSSALSVHLHIYTGTYISAYVRYTGRRLTTLLKRRRRHGKSVRACGIDDQRPAQSQSVLFRAVRLETGGHTG